VGTCVGPSTGAWTHFDKIGQIGVITGSGWETFDL